MRGIGYDPATANHSEPEFRLGEYFAQEGKIYKYVQFKDAVTYAAGHVCTPANSDGTAVTNDRAGGSDIGENKFAGVALLAMTQNYYGFVQVGGVASVLGDGSVAAGESVIPDSADGKADTMAAGEEDHVFGVALEDDDATTALFNCLINGIY